MQESLNIFNRISKRLLEEEEKEGIVKPVPFDQMVASLDLNLSEEGTSNAAFEEALTKLVLATPRTNTNKFFNQLFGRRNDEAYLGELLAVLLNNSMYTYKVGGPMIAVEQNILKNIARLVGYGDDALGTIAPGGSMTNLMAMLMARDRADNQCRFEGVQKRMIAYTSQESHYSIAKNAAFSGIGRNNVRKISADATGRMDVEKLEAQINKDIADGHLPFMVNATSGTTVLGAFDPIDKIADVCEKHKIWLHVDGAYGGSVMFTDKYKHLIKGSERSDSFSINAHKMLSTPITCSIIVTKHKSCLYESFSSEANYLFQTDTDDINPGKISMQCGRRNDALKFWALWKSRGTKGLGKIVEQEFDLARYAREYIRNHQDYTLYSFDDSVNVCFNYKGMPADEVCKQLHDQQKFVVGFGQFRDDVFVRLVFVNSRNNTSDVLAFFEAIESL